MNALAAALCGVTMLLAGCGSDEPSPQPNYADLTVCRNVAKWVDSNPDYDESVRRFAERATAVTDMGDALLLDASPELREAVWALGDRIDELVSGDGIDPDPDAITSAQKRLDPAPEPTVSAIQEIDYHCTGIGRPVLG